MDERVGWERLCALLDDDEQLVPTVLGALDGGVDPWGALLDGLDDAGVLAALQRDDTGMELADALAQLPRVFRLQLDLNDVNDTDDLDDAMRLADGLLAAGGHRLLELEEPDDEARAVVVVPDDAVAGILLLADELEHVVRLPD